jgi:uncharacterized membrane protein YozB (DUF420 family)
MTTQQLTTPPRQTPSRPSRRVWFIPAGLILLNLFPMVVGVFRLTELAGGAGVTGGNARFFESPVPTVAHIVGATVFCLLGAFQFVPQLRPGRSGWHRIAGRILVPAGLIAGVSGMWLAVNLPRPDVDVFVRLFFASLMVGSILLGLRAILRRDFKTHRAWMIRGYAIGAAAGTQALTAIGWALITGGAEADATTAVALVAAAWVINLAVAEVAIRRSVA